MSRITEEKIIAEDIIATRFSRPKYKNAFGEEFILMPIFNSKAEYLNNDVSDYIAIFINEFKFDRIIKLDNVIIDGEFTHDDKIKNSLYYFISSEDEDYITLYEIDLVKNIGA